MNLFIRAENDGFVFCIIPKYIITFIILDICTYIIRSDCLASCILERFKDNHIIVYLTIYDFKSFSTFAEGPGVVLPESSILCSILLSHLGEIRP